MTAFFAYVVAHWPVIVMLGTPPLGILVATIVSMYSDPDHDPKTPPPVWVIPFLVIQQLMTLRAAHGRKGIEGVGDGRWSFPLVHYPIVGEPVPSRGGVPPSPPAAPSSSSGVVPTIVFVLLLGQIAACACFTPASPEYNSKKCVISRQAVDCTKSSVIGLVMAVGPALALAILSGAPIDLAKIAEQAEKGGIGNGLCLLAALEADLIKPAAGPAPVASAKDKAHSVLVELAHKVYGPGPVDIKIKAEDGKALRMISVQ
jgi:hypothetical protein